MDFLYYLFNLILQFINDFLSNKRQQLWLRKISIDLRGHFFRLKESSMRYRSEKGLVYYRRPKETILN